MRVIILIFCFLLLCSCSNNSNSGSERIPSNSIIVSEAFDFDALIKKRVDNSLDNFLKQAPDNPDGAFLKIKNLQGKETWALYLKSAGSEEFWVRALRQKEDQKIKRSEVLDWMIELPNSTILGGFTSQKKIILNQYNGDTILTKDLNIPNFANPIFINE